MKSNYDYLVENKQLTDFLYNLVETVAELANLEITENFTEKQLEILDKFRDKYPTCHPLNPIFLALDISNWLQAEYKEME